MKTKLFSAGILGFGLLVSAMIVTNGASAQTAEDAIQFPVAELGNCKDKDACKTYCDDADNLEACLAFAEDNNLMSEKELTIAKKFLEAGGEGPGGCTGKESCETYCDDISHIDACVAFAEKAGILPPEELAEAKQVQAAIARGVKPPACGSKKKCDEYCEDSSHMKECITFGEAAGFLKGGELEDAKKMLTAIDNGAVPPPCRGREACDTYCSEPDNMEACMTFARAAGFMTPEEAQNSEKMLVALKKGVKPPRCKGKEECDVYCTESAHADECIQFAVAAGFMNEKEAEMAKKTGGKGPGGCVGKDACDAFCGNQDNQQTCMDFAKENGFDEGPGERNGDGGNRGFSGPNDNQNGGQNGGPGGCKGPEECKTYCQSHQEECQEFVPSGGQGGFINQQQQNQQQDQQQGGQYGPGNYPNQGPPPGEETSGVNQYQQQYEQQYQQQYQEQYQQQYQQMMPPPEMDGGGSEGGEFIPTEPILQEQPIEQTAPQSSNFDLNNALAFVMAAFKEFKF